MDCSPHVLIPSVYTSLGATRLGGSPSPIYFHPSMHRRAGLHSIQLHIAKPQAYFQEHHTLIVRLRDWNLTVPALIMDPLMLWYEPDVVPFDGMGKGSEQPARAVSAFPQKSVQEEQEADLSGGERVFGSSGIFGSNSSRRGSCVCPECR